VSRHLRQAVERWREFESDLVGEHPWIACCAYCGHVRTHSGEWLVLAPGVLDVLKRSQHFELTHGFCPECLSGLDVEQRHEFKRVTG
jgi:hypothetical protein